MKKIIGLFLLFLIFPNTALAFEKMSGTSIVVDEKELINGSLFVQGDKVDIKGEINGDLFVLAPTLEVSGVVNGDIIALGEAFSLTGTSTGDLRLAFGSIAIDGVVEGNISVLAENLMFGDFAMAGGDFLVLAKKASVSGEIGKSLFGWIRDGDLSSSVGGDVSLKQGKGFFSNNINPEFILLENTEIKGDLNFESKYNLREESGARVLGDKNVSKANEEESSANYFWAIVSIFSTILVSFVLIALFNKFLITILGSIGNNSLKLFWIGLLFLFLTPISFVLLLLTIIGIPLATILLFIFISIALLYKSILSIFLGGRILNILKLNSKNSLNLMAVVGSPAIYLLFQIPLIGSVFSFFGMIIILGGFLEYFRTRLTK